MFYSYYRAPLIYYLILIAAAVIPAIFLMIKVYQSDRVEKESPRLLWKIALAGILSTILAVIEERVGELILSWLFYSDTVLYRILLNFIVIGIAEETSKFLLLKRCTWTDREFNCQYDGVVYAVFVSLGFALFENIGYAFAYGFGNTILRALTAIPGHACFGVFMGVFYGLSKRYGNAGFPDLSKRYSNLAMIIPALIHGTYDFIASAGQGVLAFVVFIIALFFISFRLIRTAADQDQFI